MRLRRCECLRRGLDVALRHGGIPGALEACRASVATSGGAEDCGATEGCVYRGGGGVCKPRPAGSRDGQKEGGTQGWGRSGKRSRRKGRGGGYGGWAVVVKRASWAQSCTLAPGGVVRDVKESYEQEQAGEGYRAQLPKTASPKIAPHLCPRAGARPAQNSPAQNSPAPAGCKARAWHTTAAGTRSAARACASATACAKLWLTAFGACEMSSTTRGETDDQSSLAGGGGMRRLEEGEAPAAPPASPPANTPAGVPPAPPAAGAALSPAPGVVLFSCRARASTRPQRRAKSPAWAGACASTAGAGSSTGPSFSWAHSRHAGTAALRDDPTPRARTAPTAAATASSIWARRESSAPTSSVLSSSSVLSMGSTIPPLRCRRNCAHQSE
eukprot:scaffold27519_cov98-Isochrysis_galbana.AAC.2